MPLASAILADINMRFSHYLRRIHSDSVRCTGINDTVDTLRWIKPY